MPKSKRSTVVNLTKTGKKATRESKGELVSEIQEQADMKDFAWVLEFEQSRTKWIQEVRGRWKPEKMYMAKRTVMKKALGNSSEDEYKPGAAKLAESLSGQTGLLFTDSRPFIVTDWFDSYAQPDYARTGNVAPQTITVKAGPVMMEDSVATHSIEPQLRKLGMPTKLVKGVPTIDDDFVICTQGEVLKANQVNLLMLFNHLLSTFKIKPVMGLDLKSGNIIKPEDVKPEDS